MAPPNNPLDPPLSEAGSSILRHTAGRVVFLNIVKITVKPVLEDMPN